MSLRGGASRTRTGDLLGAIHPVFRPRTGLFAARFGRAPGVPQHLPQYFAPDLQSDACLCRQRRAHTTTQCTRPFEGPTRLPAGRRARQASGGASRGSRRGVAASHPGHCQTRRDVHQDETEIIRPTARRVLWTPSGGHPRSQRSLRLPQARCFGALGEQTRVLRGELGGPPTPPRVRISHLYAEATHRKLAHA